MIVCQCNALSDRDVIAALQRVIEAPLSPAQIYRCMGCKPDCGRCAPTLRALLDRAGAGGCAIGCPGCPSDVVAALGNDAGQENAAVAAA